MSKLGDAGIIIKIGFQYLRLGSHNLDSVQTPIGWSCWYPPFTSFLIPTDLEALTSTRV
mgnify:CR=1 FL=1